MGNPHRSLPISVLTWAVNIALVAEIAIIVIVLSTLAVTIVTDEELLSAWPVAISDTGRHYQLSTENGNIESMTLSINEGTLQFSSMDAGYHVLKSLDAVSTLLFALLVTILLKRFISTIANKNTFCEENAIRLRLMAILVLLVAPYQLLQACVYHGYIRENIVVAGATFTSLPVNAALTDDTAKIWLQSEFNVQALLLGLLLLVIAEAFRTGLDLRTDNESIV